MRPAVVVNGDSLDKHSADFGSLDMLGQTVRLDCQSLLGGKDTTETAGRNLQFNHGHKTSLANAFAVEARTLGAALVPNRILLSVGTKT